MPNEFSTMREIGEAFFGVSSHVIGKRLKALGFRTANGKPSSQAFACGMVQRRFADNGEHYCWAWHTVDTVLHLAKTGLPMKTATPAIG